MKMIFTKKKSAAAVCLLLFVVVGLLGDHGTYAFEDIINPLAKKKKKGNHYYHHEKRRGMFKKKRQHHHHPSGDSGVVYLLQSLNGGGNNGAAALPPGTGGTITFQSDRRGVLSWILNCLWLGTVGWSMCLTWFVVGLGLCCTIIGLPVGLQAIKLSFFLLFPFGKKLQYKTKSTTGGIATFFCNLVWALTVGWLLAIQAIVNGFFLCTTIVGIPFGIQCFKFAHLCFRPFGLDYSAIEETTYVVMEQQQPPAAVPPPPVPPPAAM